MDLSQTRLQCATANRTSALVSVKLAVSQAPANTARPQMRAGVSCRLPVCSPALSGYSFHIPTEG